MILFGAAVLSFGLYNIHSRCAVTEGGALGLSLLLDHWFRISPAISSLVLDLAAMLVGTIILKNSFLLDSVIASVCYSVWYALFEKTGPLLPDLSGYPFLAAVIGGIFVGIGTSMIVSQGCAAGADDSFALILHKKTGMKLAILYSFTDISVLLLSLTYIPLNRIMWSLLSVCISSGMIGLLCPSGKAQDKKQADHASA